jgi:hypothetical protein
MKVQAIITAMAVALLIALVPGSEAEGPAHLYYFDGDGTCIHETVLLPDTPLPYSEIPPAASYMAWYDEDGRHVVGGITFSAGEHTITQYPLDDPPERKDGGGGWHPSGTAIAGGMAVAAFAAFVALAVIYRRR